MRTRAAVVPPERASDAAAAHEAALRLLERARRTRADLARRLRDAGHDGATVEAVLLRLDGVGLVDDVEYARAFLAGRWSRRAAGWRRLETELRTRGVAPADIASARQLLEADRGTRDEAAAAGALVVQAMRRYARLEPRQRRHRLYALLVRRGFDGEVIRRALREHAVLE